MLKNLTRKQIIVIISSLVIITGVIVTSVFLLNKDTKEEIKKCLVEFETNGGTSIESQEIECGNTIKEPSVKPEKVGFEFIGWYLDEVEFDFNKKIDKNIVLIANYNKTTDEELVVVTFDSKEGTEVKPIELVKGTTITEPVKPTRNGYSFEGWYLNEEIFDFSKEINENITLVARWKENKSNQNQGGNAGNSQKPNGGSSGTQGGSTGENNNPSNPGGTEEKPQPKPKPEEKDEYTFVENARLEDSCSNSNYQPYDGFCYLAVSRKFITNGCEGREINGKCYKINTSGKKYLCNGEDKNDGNYCQPKVYDIKEPYSDGTCPGKLWGEYTLNADGKCEGYYFDSNNRYLATVQRYCSTEGMLVDNDEKCATEIGYSNFYEKCPSGYDFGSSKYCYRSSTKTSVIKKYKCGSYVGSKPTILIGDKCYIKK